MASPVPSSDGHPSLEAAILEAASDLLARGGVQGLSMRQVADRVGVSATAIYHYFKGKDDLVDRVVRQGFERFGEYLERAIAAHPRGSLARVRALGDAYMRFALENQAYFRVIFSMQSQGERTVEDHPEGGGYQLLRECVVDAIASGEMCAADPDLLSLYLWSVVHGLVTLNLSCTEPLCAGETMPQSPVDLYQAFAPFVVDGIRFRPPAGGTRHDGRREE
jgi:AcrR family transcriptional regulator